MTDTFLKTGEVAVLFGCNRRTVERWCGEGFIVAKKWNGRWLINRESLQKQWHFSDEKMGIRDKRD